MYLIENVFKDGHAQLHKLRQQVLVKQDFVDQQLGSTNYERYFDLDKSGFHQSKSLVLDLFPLHVPVYCNWSEIFFYFVTKKTI